MAKMALAEYMEEQKKKKREDAIKETAVARTVAMIATSSHVTSSNPDKTTTARKTSTKTERPSLEQYMVSCKADKGYGNINDQMSALGCGKIHNYQETTADYKSDPDYESTVKAGNESAENKLVQYFKNHETLDKQDNCFFSGNNGAATINLAAQAVTDVLLTSRRQPVYAAELRFNTIKALVLQV